MVKTLDSFPPRDNKVEASHSFFIPSPLLSPFYIRSAIIKRGSQQEAPYILRVCRLKRNHWNLIGRKKKMVIFSGIEMREGELLRPKMAAAPFFFLGKFSLRIFLKGKCHITFPNRVPYDYMDAFCHGLT